jgi:hypothetical protein
LFVAPGVADGEYAGRGRDAVAHGERGVGLLVERVCDEGDGGAGDELADEDDAALAGAVGLGAGDVKAEVHFFEARVEGDGEAENADTVEEESDEGDVATALVEIEFDAGREPRGEGGGWHLILGHDELAPFGSEEGGHLALSASRLSSNSLQWSQVHFYSIFGDVKIWSSMCFERRGQLLGYSNIFCHKRKNLWMHP